MASIVELILEPLVKAYGRGISGLEIIGTVTVFLFTLFAAMYGRSGWLALLG